jgi:hypothetical protein
VPSLQPGRTLGRGQRPVWESSHVEREFVNGSSIGWELPHPPEEHDSGLLEATRDSRGRSDSRRHRRTHPSVTRGSTFSLRANSSSLPPPNGPACTSSSSPRARSGSPAARGSPLPPNPWEPTSPSRSCSPDARTPSPSSEGPRRNSIAPNPRPRSVPRNRHPRRDDPPGSSPLRFERRRSRGRTGWSGEPRRSESRFRRADVPS